MYEYFAEIRRMQYFFFAQTRNGTGRKQSWNAVVLLVILANCAMPVRDSASIIQNPGSRTRFSEEKPYWEREERERCMSNVRKAREWVRGGEREKERVCVVGFDRIWKIFIDSWVVVMRTRKCMGKERWAPNVLFFIFLGHGLLIASWSTNII